MKKLIIGVLLLVGGRSIVAQDNEVRFLQADTVQSVQNTCSSIPMSHWSFVLKSGMNFYRMFSSDASEVDKLGFSWGGSAQYSFNPLVGLGLEFLSGNYSRSYLQNGVSANLNCKSNELFLFTSFNLTNALAPIRYNFSKQLNLFADFGGGLAFFQCASAGTVLSGPSPTFVGKVGLNLEITLNKNLNVFCGGEYHPYSSRRMSQGLGTRNADSYQFCLGLRYKFAKQSKHALNIGLQDYSPAVIPDRVTKTYRDGDTYETLARLKMVEERNGVLKQKIGQKQSEVDQLITTKL
jgi:hypothetical protein